MFNVADDLADDMYEGVEAEDAELGKSRMQYLIQIVSATFSWFPKKVFSYYWTRKHVVILPSWAFNKLILGKSEDTCFL